MKKRRGNCEKNCLEVSTIILVSAILLGVISVTSEKIVTCQTFEKYASLYRKSAVSLGEILRCLRPCSPAVIHLKTNYFYMSSFIWFKINLKFLSSLASIGALEVKNWQAKISKKNLQKLNIFKIVYSKKIKELPMIDF